MKLIVGLGNPGKEYEATPHNIGFRCVDALSEALRTHDDMEYSGSQRHRLYWTEEFWRARPDGDRENIVLLKPQTFMNESGVAVKEYLRYHGNTCAIAQDVWVVHDDADIALGDIRVDRNKSSAGHKGVQSMIDHLGTRDFVRFRFGIRKGARSQKAATYVLKRPRKEEGSQYEASIQRMQDGILIAIRVSVEKAQLFLNTKTRLSQLSTVRGASEELQ